jgi:hypothetical protein
MLTSAADSLAPRRLDAPDLLEPFELDLLRAARSCAAARANAGRALW